MVQTASNQTFLGPNKCMVKKEENQKHPRWVIILSFVLQNKTDRGGQKWCAISFIHHINKMNRLNNLLHNIILDCFQQ